MRPSAFLQPEESPPIDREVQGTSASLFSARRCRQFEFLIPLDSGNLWCLLEDYGPNIQRTPTIHELWSTCSFNLPISRPEYIFPLCGCCDFFARTFVHIVSLTYFATNTHIPSSATLTMEQVKWRTCPYPAPSPFQPGGQALADKLPHAVDNGMDNSRVAVANAVHSQGSRHGVQRHHLPPCHTWQGETPSGQSTQHLTIWSGCLRGVLLLQPNAASSFYSGADEQTLKPQRQAGRQAAYMPVCPAEEKSQTQSSGQQSDSLPR